MAFHSFSLLPSADIHLRLKAPSPEDNNRLQLRVNGYYDDSLFVEDITSKCTFEISDNTVATVTSNGQLNPIAEGRVFLRVSCTDNTDTSNPIIHQLVARVWVHRSIISVWLGNNSLSVNKGLNNLVVSIYALFNNRNIGDITGHGYVPLEIDHTSIATSDVFGRITGIIEGNTILRAKISLINAYSSDQEIQLSVKPLVGSPKEIVEKVHFNGSGPQFRNILFLSEGFTQSEENRFRNLVHLIADRMTRARSDIHEPFKLLNRDYNIWLAFEPSEERGVTVGFNTRNMDDNADESLGLLFPFPRTDIGDDIGIISVYDHIRKEGLPEAMRFHQPWDQLTNSLEIWLSLAVDSSNPILQVKNSNIGLMYGRRLGDQISVISQDPLPLDNSWYRILFQHPFSFFRIDPRRLGENLIHWDEYFWDYIRSLFSSTGKDNPNYYIGHKWAGNTRSYDGGPDQGLIIVLANDSILGGNYLHNFEKMQWNVFGAVPIGLNAFVSGVTITGDGIANHNPDTEDRILDDLVVATALHELGHAFFLGDEYEGIPLPPQIGSIWELSDNLTIPEFNDDGQIEVQRIKWNRLLRVFKSSALLDEANVVSSNQLIIELYPGEILKWRPQEKAWLRTRNINSSADTTHYPSWRNHPFFEIEVTIQSVDKSVNGDFVTLEVPSSSIPHEVVFTKGSILFIPIMDSGSPVSLILPGVNDYMSLQGALSSKNGNCRNPDVAHTVNPPDDIINIDYPDRSERLIGLYEGGAGRNCSIYRPTGNCKMRNQYDHNSHIHFKYCHVCKYTIVNEINPSKHSALDADYPGAIADEL